MKTMTVFLAGLLCGVLALGLFVLYRPGAGLAGSAPPAAEVAAAPAPAAPPSAAPLQPGVAAVPPLEDAPVAVVPASPVHEWTQPEMRPVPGEAVDPAVVATETPAADPVTAPAADPAVAAADAPMPSRPLQLRLPVSGVLPAQLVDTFTDARGEGRLHDAIDIMADTGTPVLAVEDGRIARLFNSKPGGLTIYQFDRNEELAYYYGHLDRYAAGLAEGQQVRQGDVIGYVGYTGNAKPEAPHLHFAIFILGPEKQWWRGTPINPYPWLGGR